MFIPHPVCYNLNQKEQSTQSTVHRDRWNDHRRGGNHEVLSQKVLAHCYSGLHLYGCCLWFVGLHQSGTDSDHPGTAGR